MLISRQVQSVSEPGLACCCCAGRRVWPARRDRLRTIGFCGSGMILGAHTQHNPRVAATSARIVLCLLLCLASGDGSPKGDKLGDLYIAYQQATVRHSRAAEATAFDELFRFCSLSRDVRCLVVRGDWRFQGTLFPPKRQTEAVALWRAAAALGNADAQFRLGSLHSTLFNFAAPLKSAEQIRAEPEEEVETAGGTDEWFELSMDVLDFQGTKGERETFERAALQYWLTATKADGGTATASNGSSSGRGMAPHDDLPAFARFPLHKHDSIALLYLYAASQMNHVGARLALGFRHLHGLGVPRRCQAAAAHFLFVARQVAEVTARGIPAVAEVIRLNLDSLLFGWDFGKAAAYTAKVADLQLHLAEAGNPRVQTAVAKKLLLGLEGFPQDVERAVAFFKEAAKQGSREAMACLGHLSVLGVGVERDTAVAYELFTRALGRNDVVAHNGLGYLFFTGSSPVKQNLDRAVYHFNVVSLRVIAVNGIVPRWSFFLQSASRGFPDAMFNLASLYLTGTGVQQSFMKATALLTRALEHGHTGAMYLLGVLHLNGFGTVKDCDIAAGLFKRTAERHVWVAKNLQRAYAFQSQDRLDDAAFVFWQLAEAGVEAAQVSLAQLLDGGGRPLSVRSRGEGLVGLARQVIGSIPLARRVLFRPTTLFSATYDVRIGVNRVTAQRYWNMAALQRSVLASVRLGDYSRQGWGVAVVPPVERERVRSILSRTSRKTSRLLDSEGKSMRGWAVAHPVGEELFVMRSSPDYEEAFYFYELAARASADAAHLRPLVRPSMAKAEFSLSLMYQRAQGVPRDLRMARRKLQRVAELDVEHLAYPVRIALCFLRLHSFFVAVAETSVIKVLRCDARLAALFANAVVFLSLAAVLRPLVSRKHLSSNI